MKPKFFNFKQECKELNININQGANCLCIVTPRGTGKTTSVIKDIINTCIKLDRSFVFCRTTDIETKNAKKLFEVFNNDVKVINDEIWLVKRTIENDEEKIEKIRTLGYIVCVTSASKFKSAFENDGCKIDIGYVIYDEFNDIKMRKNIYEEFTNLITTLKRNNPNFWVVMLGNKDSQNNCFLVDWGIRFKSEIQDKFVLDMRDEIGVIYVEYGAKVFAGINASDNFISKFASANDEMNRFMNHGGFRKTSIGNIIKYSKWIEPNIIRKFYNIIIRKNNYEVGIFNDTFTDTPKCLYFRKVDFSERDRQIPTLCVGGENIVGRGVNALDDEDAVEFAEFVKSYQIQDKLYFNSFEAYIDVLQEIYIILKYKTN